eukprot:114055-Prymnesium_polylepis.1
MPRVPCVSRARLARPDAAVEEIAGSTSGGVSSVARSGGGVRCGLSMLPSTGALLGGARADSTAQIRLTLLPPRAPVTPPASREADVSASPDAD